METTTSPGRNRLGQFTRDARNLVTAIGILAAGLAKLASAVELPAMDARLRIEAAQDVRAAADEVKRWLAVTDVPSKPASDGTDPWQGARERPHARRPVSNAMPGTNEEDL